MNLQRGERIELDALINPSQAFVVGMTICLPDVEVDCACFCLDDQGRALSDDYVVFYNQPTTPCGGVSLAAPLDDAAGFEVNFSKLSNAITRLVFVATTDGNQGFRSVRASYARLLRNGQIEACRFEVDGATFSDEKALMVLELYRRDDKWRLAAIGQGFAGGMAVLVHHFGLIVGAQAATASPPRPPESLLLMDAPQTQPEDQCARETTSRAIEQTLAEYRVKGSVTGCTSGPVVTTYAFAPAPGVKLARVIDLGADLALRLATSGLRIDPIFVDGVIGIEIPNRVRELVRLRRVMDVDRDQRTPLLLAFGVDNRGTPIWEDLERLPHLLVAGSTRSGKSVALHAMLCAILLHARESEVRIVLIDPKRAEFVGYEGAPHLLAPVLTDPRQATIALDWLMREMDRRYARMEALDVRNLEGWRLKVGSSGDAPPLQLVMIDEFADLMLQSGKAVEVPLVRIAQMGRAAGIHLIVATQRPSKEVLTPIIKANVPARLSFRVTSAANSKIILDEPGAENLIGNGDGLLSVPGQPLLRIQAPMVLPHEIRAILQFLKLTRTTQYDVSLMQRLGGST